MSETSDLTERVIEAAAEAMHDRLLARLELSGETRFPDAGDRWQEAFRDYATVAIRAADAARADAVLAALAHLEATRDRLLGASMFGGPRLHQATLAEVNDARRELLALMGIADDGGEREQA